jgi:putative thioredoxin
VDFWAPWCGPCRALTPTLDRLASEYGDRIRIVKVNSDDEQQLAARYGVRSIPNVKAFVDGQMADEFLGAQPESAVRAFIEALLPSPAETLRKRGRDAIAAGDAEQGIALLAEARTADPRNAVAAIDLAEALLSADRSHEALLTLESLGPAPELGGADEQRFARLRLRLDAAATTDEPELRTRLERAPADLAARLALARRLLASDRAEEAMDHLLEVVRRDRRFEDDAGRKALLQAFQFLGPGHPLVPRYRKLLAATLH